MEFEHVASAVFAQTTKVIESVLASEIPIDRHSEISGLINRTEMAIQNQKKKELSKLGGLLIRLNQPNGVSSDVQEEYAEQFNKVFLGVQAEAYLTAINWTSEQKYSTLLDTLLAREFVLSADFVVSQKLVQSKADFQAILIAQKNYWQAEAHKLIGSGNTMLSRPHRSSTICSAKAAFRVEQLMISRGMSQDQLAGLAKTTRKTIGHFLKTGTLRGMILNDIAEVFETTVGDLTS